MVLKVLFLTNVSNFSAMPKKILNAKVACLDFSLQKTKMKLGVQVCIFHNFHNSFSHCFLCSLLCVIFVSGFGDRP